MEYFTLTQNRRFDNNRELINEFNNLLKRDFNASAHHTMRNTWFIEGVTEKEPLLKALQDPNSKFYELYHIEWIEL